MGLGMRCIFKRGNDRLRRRNKLGLGKWKEEKAFLCGEGRIERDRLSTVTLLAFYGFALVFRGSSLARLHASMQQEESQACSLDFRVRVKNPVLN